MDSDTWEISFQMFSPIDLTFGPPVTGAMGWRRSPSPYAIHLSPGNWAGRVNMAGSPSVTSRRSRGIAHVLSREPRGIMQLFSGEPLGSPAIIS